MVAPLFLRLFNPVLSGNSLVKIREVGKAINAMEVQTGSHACELPSPLNRLRLISN